MTKLLNIYTSIVSSKKGYIVKCTIHYEGNTFEAHSNDYIELTMAEDEAVRRAKELAGIK